MDAIIYLRAQHNKVRQAFKVIKKTANEKSKLAKFNALCKELICHETMEQKAWYPVLRKNKELAKVIKHLLVEEKDAAKAIKQFKKMEFGMLWKLKFIKFHHDVDHHAKEEEKKLFPQVRKFLPKEDLNKLGVKLKKTMSQLKKSM